MTNLGESSNIISEAIPCEEISDPAVLVKTPLVSVKMITYNHEAYIAQAIEGVLQQKTDFPIELVIGEDCSTDGTREIVFDFQKKYPDIIRVITSDKNVGVKKNSYRTDKSCRGKYIAYCEGDDYWHHPQKLQKQVDYLENHPECGLVFSDFYSFHVNTGILIKDDSRFGDKTNMILNEPHKLLTAILHYKCPILTCTVCVRKDLLDPLHDADPLLYRTERFLMGDTQRWAELSQVSKLAYLNEPLATHNLLTESAAHSRDIRKTLSFRKSGAELCLYLAKKYGLPESEVKHFQELVWNHALRLAFYENNVELAEEVKKSKKSLTTKEWVEYWGSKSMFLNYTLRSLVLFRKWICEAYRQLSKHGRTF